MNSRDGSSDSGELWVKIGPYWKYFLWISLEDFASPVMSRPLPSALAPLLAAGAEPIL